MKKETVEKLKRSLEEAVEIESGQRLPARVTTREIPEQIAEKVASRLRRARRKKPPEKGGERNA
jgi:hypothetical protein